MNIIHMLMAADRVNAMPRDKERIGLAVELCEELQKSNLLQCMITFESTRLAKIAAWKIKNEQATAHDVYELPLKADGTPYTYREAKLNFRVAEDNHDRATIALHDAIKEMSV